MSLLSFTKCFIGAGGEQAATALTTAMVKMAPETATAAELRIWNKISTRPGS